MIQNEAHWYALHVKPHKERAVYEQLLARDITAYYPHVRVKPKNPRSINWDSTGNGGTTMQSASFTMYSTTGQAITTPMQGSDYTPKNGFWSGVFGDIYEIFLPMIQK